MLGKLWLKWRHVPWWVRWIVYAVVPIVLFYVVEDLRGWWAWKSYRKAAEARGDRFEVEAWDSEPIPDEENFAATPLIRDIFRRKGDFDPPSKIHHPREYYDPFPNVYRELGRDLPLEICYEQGRFSRAEAARQIEIDYLPWEPIITELVNAVQRPGCNYPVDLADERHHFSIWLNVTVVLNYRSIARIHTGDTEGALSDLEVLFGFSRHFAPAGSMTATSVGEPHRMQSTPLATRMELTYLCLQSVWEGLKSKVWNDSQLERLGHEISLIDLSEEVTRSFLIERSVVLAELDQLGIDPLYRHERFGHYRDFQFLPHSGNRRIEEADAILSRILLTIAPRGWYRQNMRNICREWESFVNSRPWDPAFQPLDSTALGSRIFSTRPTPYTAFLEDCGPSAGMKLIEQAKVYQTVIELVEVAIALERYRLAESVYPKTLEDLTPTFLESVPEDPFAASLPRINYLMRTDGTSAVYSVGPNGIDDGGQPHFDSDRGDLTWQYTLPPGFTAEDYRN